MSKSKGIAEVGVRTRARTVAMAAAKKRKVDSAELELSSSCQRRRRLVLTPKQETSKNSGGKLPDSSRSSDLLAVSRCSSNGSSELVNQSLIRSVVDLENQSSTCCREITPSSSFREESEDLKSMERSSIMARSTDERISPPEAEIEGFFSNVEREEHTRFAEKYNYDIVKDVPLKGRYEWVRLKP